MEKRGIIALDIDGTLTDESHLIPDAVAHYLKELSSSWHICLITGRTLSFAEHSISKLDFPYVLGVQNGADILQMPEKKPLHRSYVSIDTVIQLDAFLENEPEDFILYAGFDRGDFCYWRPEHMSPALQEHCRHIARLSPAPWVELEDFTNLNQGYFPLVKYFGAENEVLRIDASLKKFNAITTSVIKDPLSPQFSLILITDHGANKGKALRRIVELASLSALPIIAAGDDANDISMLEMADVKIVIGTAPAHMQRHADIVGKPSKEYGILSALPEAINLLERR